MKNPFRWDGAGSAPSIETHTKRKLEVIKNYLDVYFDTVVPNPATDDLNITLVDGFCGGGLYIDGTEHVPGSPLLLLQAVSEATERLNEKRIKPLKVNARFIFIDINRDHVESLKRVVMSSEFWDQNKNNISFITSSFEKALPDIIQTIKSKQRVGRSIFVLDQKGYKDVPMTTIQTIFKHLDRAEVLLTFAIDAVLNYLREQSSSEQLYQQFGVNEEFVAFWNEKKDDDELGRAVTQQVLINKIHSRSGAQYFTPFMLWSNTDNRWMMLAHMSHHQAARDKMLSVHWDTQNRFTHIGKGSLFHLGFDYRNFESRNSLFNFNENDLLKLKNELENELPRELHSVASSDQQINVKDFLAAIGNRTAARNEHIFSALTKLAQEREIEISNKDGRPKRSSTEIKISDQIILPQQRSFFSKIP
ncbi:three-Cys-motif partner protein TcmP [Mariluticola halotolerans]|uniref:three-Cys-motif partner protein TcmP n=1 Tax=Mariluticola halotolerans TaxID=2909283 RepID=UPI0026E448C6|nr:three-Cys-motif partner protein TcmP [Mariluticola halotolerans]UJQ94155.1 three-Cys-motif partner protein TcmP [Mariluticola halotolerans]